MNGEKDLLVAKYITERTRTGYMARIVIACSQTGKTEVDYTYPREFADMNDALAKGFELVGRWRRKYAPDAEVVIEPPSMP
jgi:hypothetical protein